MIDLLQQTAAAWHEEHPELDIGFGDISKLGGGAPSEKHKTGHNLGLEVDVRPLRMDGAYLPTNINNKSYDRDATDALIQFFLGFKSGVIRTILFNDTSIAGVKPAADHDNHFHVSFFSGVNCR